MPDDWTTRPLVGFDLETTGVDPETARIVTGSIVHIDPTSGTVDVMGWLANPGIPIPAEATAVHGITTEYATEHGWEPGKVATEIVHQLRLAWQHNHPLVIFNAPYDLTVLDRELRRYDYAGLRHVGPVLDPLVIDRASDRYRRGKRTLGACCTEYGVELKAAHTSTADAEAAVWLLLEIAKRYPTLVQPLPELQTLQRAHHMRWAAEFEAYLRTQGKGDTINPAWPIRPATSQPA